MSRFNDNQDGTITDTETSLTWQKKDFFIYVEETPVLEIHTEDLMGVL